MNPRPGQPQLPFPEEFLMPFLGLFCTLLVVWLVVDIFYLLTLQKALNRVSPRNRLMEPGQVWLMFVPCLNIVWGFLIAIRIPDSLKNEFQARGRDDGSDYGKTIGLTYCILSLVGGFLGNGVSKIPDMEAVGSIISVIVLVINFALLIVFWVKISNYSKMLEADDDGRYRKFDRRFGDDDDDDRDDDRGDDDRGYDNRGSPKAGGGAAPDAIKEGDPGSYKT
jgi:hypothetical protein